MADWAHHRFFARGNDIFVMGHIHHALHDGRDGREFLIVGDWYGPCTFARLHRGALTLETFTGSGPG